MGLENEFTQPYAEYPAVSWGIQPFVKEGIWYCQNCGEVVNITDSNKIARYNGAYSMLHYAHAPGGQFCGWLGIKRS